MEAVSLALLLGGGVVGGLAMWGCYSQRLATCYADLL